jgi:type I restriction enzyme S subunit
MNPKQTPNGWQVKKLKETGEAIIGLTYSPKDVVEYGGVEVLRSSNVFDGRIVLDDLVRVDAKISEKLILREGDILVCARNGSRRLIGKNARISKNNAGKTFGAFMCVYRSYNPDYMYWVFQTESFRKQIARDLGPTINQVTSGNLNSFKFAFPEKGEQERIVAILEAWDEYLEKLDKKIELKKNIKKGLMQQLLMAKKRLPGFNGNWDYISIGSLGSVVTGNTPPKNEPDNYGGEYLWATAEDFVNKYIEKTNVTLSSKGESRARTVPAGSILVTCIASIGKNAIAKRTLAMNQQINAITVSDKYDNEFFYYQIGNSKNKLLKAAGSGAMPMLNKNEFSKIKLFAPTDKAEQTAIASLLSSADLEIDLLQGCRALIDNQRRFLLNNLVSGKIRTPENLTMPAKEVQYA